MIERHNHRKDLHTGYECLRLAVKPRQIWLGGKPKSRDLAITAAEPPTAGGGRRDSMNGIATKTGGEVRAREMKIRPRKEFQQKTLQDALLRLDKSGEKELLLFTLVCDGFSVCA